VQYYIKYVKILFFFDETHKIILSICAHIDKKDTNKIVLVVIGRDLVVTIMQ